MKTTKVIIKLSHDTGAAKISTYATSIDEAIKKVCEAENAPKQAVIYAKVAPITIYDIKRLTQETSPNFFARKEMRFFKQKLSDFSVTRKGDDKFLISAPRPFGKTERLFNPFTNKLEFV
jgi:hypothetical protein